MKSLEQVPWVPGLFGGMLAMIRSREDFFRRALLAGHGEPLVQARLPFMGHAVFPRTLAAALEAMNDKRFPRPSKLEQVMGPLIGPSSIITTSGCEWQKRRDEIKEPFGARAIRAMQGNINKIVKDWVDSLPIEKHIDLMPFINDLVEHVAQCLLFGSVDKNDTLQEVAHIIRKLVRISFVDFMVPWRRTRQPRFLHLGFWRMIERFESLLNQLIDERLAEVRQHGNETLPADLLTMLVKPLLTNDTPEMRQRIRTHVASILSGAEGPTQAMIGWTISYLTIVPSWLNKVTDEAKNFWESTDNDPEADELARLVNTTQALKESIRLWPPSFMQARETAENTDLGGYFVPKDTNVVIMPTLLHHNPLYFPNPMVWSPETHFSGPDPKAFIPFLRGGHVCPGMPLAMAIGKTVISCLLNAWRLGISDSDLPPASIEGIIRPKHVRVYLTTH